MPGDERATKSAERCEIHPLRASVGSCERCGRGLCVSCAVPVRGVVLGPECLADVLGDAEPAPAPARRIPDPLALAVGIALLIAVVATFFPWTRFGSGSQLAGAWTFDGRWSFVAVSASAAALIGWVVLARHGRGVALVGIGVLAAVAATGSVMAILNPPPFTKPALAPWIALAGNAFAAVTAAVGVVRTRTQRV